MTIPPNPMPAARLTRRLALAALLLGSLVSPAAPAQAQQTASWRTLMRADFQEVVTREGRRWAPRFPPEVERLGGRQIRLSGYMIPLGYAEQQTHFLLSALPGHGCFFHMPGGPSAIMEVQASRGVPFGYDVVAIQGRLELLRDDPYGLLYRLVDARPVR